VDEPLPSTGRGSRFVNNVLWGWLGVGVNIFIGLVIQRYIVRTLGAERYGIWVLVFSILDYLWFFDLGLNTAVTNFCARLLATREPEKINEVINTALFYFFLLGVGIIGFTTLAASYVAGFFQVSPAYRQEFLSLLLLTGLSWGLGIILHMFVSALDGFQRFDLTNRVQVATLVLRSTGYAASLALGYGLAAMAMVFVATQLLSYGLNFLNFRRVFQELRFSRALVRFSMFRQILHYGLRSFVASAAGLLQNQGSPILIGHFLPTAFVGYFSLPQRLLQYAVEAVSRIGMVTRSSAAEMQASGRRDDVLNLGIYSNRYSFTLFMPLVLALLVYGRELIQLWVGAAFADHSAPLLPIMTLATAFALAGQFNSSAILFGLGEHGAYARGVLAEALLNITAMIFVIPRYGILGAAWVSACLMLVNRGFYTPWLVCRALDFGFFEFLRSIYLRPVLIGLPVLALAYLAKVHGLGGSTWLEVIAGSGGIALLYGILAFFFCIERSHRGLFVSKVPFLTPALRDALGRS
jgi:O-antigen/teichoic acid export membrane protein